MRLLYFIALCAPALAWADNDCDFSVVGDTLSLNGDCTTDSTLFVPDGFTLDGNGHTIRAVDPPNRPFLGAIIESAGSEAHVRDIELYTVALKNVCHGIQDANAPDGAGICDRDLIPDPRLKAVYFRCAGGSIEDVRVVRVHQTSVSPCNEGNGIEVRNDTLGPDLVVTIRNNYVRQYQKIGILVVGGVDATIEGNLLLSRESARVAPNGIQVSHGASASIIDNAVFYNRFSGLGFASAGILVESANRIYVADNSVAGNDIGVWVLDAANAFVERNRVRDNGLFGIAVDDQAGAVEKTTIADNDVSENYYGVGVFGVGSEDTRVDGNRLKGNEVGVYSGPEARSTVVFGNTLWNSSGFAVVIDGDGAEVEGNTLFGNANSSITIRGDANRIIENQVRQAGTTGVYVEGEGNRIESNDVLASGALDMENIGLNKYLTNVCETSSGPPVDCGE